MVNDPKPIEPHSNTLKNPKSRYIPRTYIIYSVYLYICVLMKLYTYILICLYVFRYIGVYVYICIYYLFLYVGVEIIKYDFSIRRFLFQNTNNFKNIQKWNTH